MEKNTIVGIIIGIIIAAVVVGAAMYFEGQTNANQANVTNSTPTNDTIVKIVSNSTDKNAITDAGNIASVKLVENGQDGGYMIEITYTNGHFRQYDAETGKLIGSDLDQDTKYLPDRSGDFD